MKKGYYLLIFLILFISVIKIISAQEDLSEPREVIARQFNISIDKIPTDPEQIKDFYLKQKLIEFVAKNKVLGPIHNFLSNVKTQVVFKILFNYPYEISSKFLIILIFWSLVVIVISMLFEAWGIGRGWKAIFIGVGITLLLSRSGFILLLSAIVLEILFKPENWWIRTILWIIFFGIMVFIYTFSRILVKYLKEQKKKKTEEESEQKLENMKSLEKGLHEHDNA